MEQRHDWAKMTFTWELFKYVFMVFIPEVVIHSQHQDEDQVRTTYDRAFLFYFILLILTSLAGGNDFYGW